MEKRKFGEKKHKKKSHDFPRILEELPLPRAGQNFWDFRSQCIEEVRSWGVECRIPPQLVQEHDYYSKRLGKMIFVYLNRDLYDRVCPKYLGTNLFMLGQRALSIFRMQARPILSRMLSLEISGRLSGWFGHIWYGVESIKSKVYVFDSMIVPVLLEYVRDK